MSTLPPIGHRPQHLQARIMGCGHPGKPGQDSKHDMCPACYDRDRFETVLMLEAKYELVTRLVGSPAQVKYARAIRAYKVDGIAQRITAGTETLALLEKLDQFRTEPAATWHINHRMYRTLPKGVRTISAVARDADLLEEEGNNNNGVF